MSYTNIGLVEHAKYMLSLKTKYMWGGIARPITASYITTLAKQYPSQYSISRQNALKACIGADYYGVDCVGLIKSYYWSGKDNGGVGSPKYSASTDVNTDGMYAVAKVKGNISTLPEKQGIILLCKTHPHVGVYIGNGFVIESTLSSRGDGVVMTRVSDFSWEYWMECPFIEYIEDKSKIPYETSGKKYVCADFNSYEIKGIYRSVGSAAIRKGMTKQDEIADRCVKGMYYPMDRFVDRKDKTQWYRHADKKLYSMKADGTPLFEQVGTYKKYKIIAPLNIRVAPVLSAPIVNKASVGEIVYAFALTPSKSDGFNWLKIVYNGKMAYCADEFLKEI